MILSSCSQTPSPPDDSMGTVSGVIKGYDPTIFQNGLWVEAYPFSKNSVSEDTPVSSSIVNSNGEYGLALPAGQYIIKLNSKGFGFSGYYYEDLCGSPYQSIRIVAKDPLTEEEKGDAAITCQPKPIEVRDGETIKNIEFNFSDKRRITGKVTDNNQNPITGVYVYAEDENSIIGQTISLQDGSYTICCLPPGKYKVWAEPIGTDFISLYFNNVFTVKNAATIDLTHELSRNNVYFQLVKGSKVTGRIIDEDNGNPIAGIHLDAFTFTENILIGQSGISNSNGTYTITGLPPGTYRIVAKDKNNHYVNEIYNNVYQDSKATPINISSSNFVVNNINFNLSPYGCITGKIYGPDYQIIKEQDILIIAYDSLTNKQVNQTEVNPDGSYTISSLFAGNYILEARPIDSINAPQFYDNKNIYNSATLLPVWNGKPTPSNFHLNFGGSIGGRVLDYETQLGIKGLKVTAINSDNPNWNKSDITMIDGRYTIKGLPPGTYQIYADSSNTQYISTYYKSEVIIINSDQYSEKDIKTMRKGGSIYGTITNIYDQPIPDIKVTVFDMLDDNNIYSVMTAPITGYYSVTGLPDGSYKIYVDTLDSKYIPKYFLNKDEFDLATPVIVNYEENEPQDPIDFILNEKGIISGYVTCKSGYSYYYEIPNLLPENYRVEVSNGISVLLTYPNNVNVKKNSIVPDINFNLRDLEQ